MWRWERGEKLSFHPPQGSLSDYAAIAGRLLEIKGWTSLASPYSMLPALGELAAAVSITLPFLLYPGTCICCMAIPHLGQSTCCTLGFANRVPLNSDLSRNFCPTTLWMHVGTKNCFWNVVSNISSDAFSTIGLYSRMSTMGIWLFWCSHSSKYNSHFFKNMF